MFLPLHFSPMVTNHFFFFSFSSSPSSLHIIPNSLTSIFSLYKTLPLSHSFSQSDSSLLNLLIWNSLPLQALSFSLWHPSPRKLPTSSLVMPSTSRDGMEWWRWVSPLRWHIDHKIIFQRLQGPDPWVFQTFSFSSFPLILCFNMFLDM